MDNYGAYQYSNNPATSFLDNHMQSSFAGTVQQSGTFGSIMTNMASGISTNASRGVVPGSGSKLSDLTPAQLAAQMNQGGVSSVLPLVGNGIIPKLMFPIAGVWSLVDGVRAYSAMKRDTTSEAAQYQRFDPSKLQYYQARNKLDSLHTQYNYY